MRYLRMQRSLRLKRRAQRPNDPNQDAQRNAAPEREGSTTTVQRRQNDTHHQ